MKRYKSIFKEAGFISGEESGQQEKDRIIKDLKEYMPEYKVDEIFKDFYGQGYKIVNRELADAYFALNQGKNERFKGNRRIIDFWKDVIEGKEFGKVVDIKVKSGIDKIIFEDGSSAPIKPKYITKYLVARFAKIK